MRYVSNAVDFGNKAVTTVAKNKTMVAAAAYVVGAIGCTATDGNHCATTGNPLTQAALCVMTGAALVQAAQSEKAKALASTAYHAFEHSAMEVARIGAPAAQSVMNLFKKAKPHTATTETKGADAEPKSPKKTA